MFSHIADFLRGAWAFDWRCGECKDDISILKLFQCIQMSVHIIRRINWRHITIWHRKSFLKTWNLYIVKLITIISRVGKKSTIFHELEKYPNELENNLVVIELKSDCDNKYFVWNDMPLFGNHLVSIWIELCCRIFDPFRLFWQHWLHAAPWLWKCFHSTTNHGKHWLIIMIVSRFQNNTLIFTKIGGQFCRNWTTTRATTNNQGLTSTKTIDHFYKCSEKETHK